MQRMQRRAWAEFRSFSPRPQRCAVRHLGLFWQNLELGQQIFSDQVGPPSAGAHQKLREKISHSHVLTPTIHLENRVSGKG